MRLDENILKNREAIPETFYVLINLRIECCGGWVAQTDMTPLGFT